MQKKVHCKYLRNNYTGFQNAYLKTMLVMLLCTRYLHEVIQNMYNICIYIFIPEYNGDGIFDKQVVYNTFE